MKRKTVKKLLSGVLCAVLLLADMAHGSAISYAAGLEKSDSIQNGQDESLSEISEKQTLLDESHLHAEQTAESVAETEFTKEISTKSETTMEEESAKEIMAETESTEESITEEESAEETITEMESTEETSTDKESSEETITEEESTEETVTETEFTEEESTEESTEEIKAANIKAETSVIKIDKTCLCVGKEIEIEKPEGYKIKWYVNDTFVADDQYTPTKDDYEKWIKAEAYLENTDESIDIEFDNINEETEPICSDSVYFSKLPVIYIDTGDDDSSPVKDKSVYIDAAMFIQNNEQVKSAVYDNTIQIKGRGNSTWGLPKKPYKIKLEKKTDLYGMGKNKHWVLLANYLDESLMRNTIASNLSKKLGLVNMETVWVDVIINGAYIGNYQLCEHIRIGDSRIDIADWESEAEDVASVISKTEGMSKKEASELEDKMKEDLSWISSGKVEYKGTDYNISSYADWIKDISGGYLFEMSSEYDEISKFMTAHELYVMINSPEYLYTNNEMMNYVQNYWNAFEDAYQSEDGYALYNGEKIHYTQMADLDSMIGYWLTMEIMGNNDAIWKSRYAYKNRGGKLYFGPVWDFDWGCGSSMVGEDACGWKITVSPSNHNFYAHFVDDPYFLQKASEKYWQVRPYLESLICDGGILDEDYEYLYESGTKNSEKWFYARGFEQDCKMFKKYMKERIAWLDEQFDTEESITKSVYTTASAHPYTKSDNNLIITLNGAESIGEGFRISPQSDAETVVRINNDQIKKLQVYINGLEYDTCTMESSEAVFTVSLSDFTEKKGTKNIISLIAKTADGKTLYTNFVSVTVTEETAYEVNRVNIKELDIPQGGKELDLTAVCTSVGIDTTSLNVIWTSEETSVSGIAKYNTSYTASMRIRAKTSAGYQLSQNTKVTINGETAETAVNEDGSLSVKISFLTDKAKLLDITAPGEIEIANGTALTEILLPETMEIITENENINVARVEWDIETIDGYAQTIVDEQDFIINGIIHCPDEIDSNGKSLSVTVPVHVRAAEIISKVEMTGLNCPEPEKILDTTAKCNNPNVKNISIVWKQGEQLINNVVDVEYNKTYTAHIILEAGIGYQFADSTEVRINNDILPTMLNESGTLTTAKDFTSRKAKLLKIIPLEEIHIASGTNLNDITLPQFVEIITEDKNITVSDVKWDLEYIANYNPANLTDQNFEIHGTLLCTELDCSVIEPKVSVQVSAHYDAAFAGDVLLEDIPSNGMIPSGLWIADIKDSLYTGTKIKPEPHVYSSNKQLKAGQDYTISYKNNINANDASSEKKAPTVVVKGKGNYAGTETASFKIIPADIESDVYADSFYVKINAKKAQKPVPDLYYMGTKLKNNKDFTITYSNASGIYAQDGEYSVTVTGINNYTGTKTLTLTAVAQLPKKKLVSITNATLVGFEKSFLYTGKACKQQCTLKIQTDIGEKALIEGTDYTVHYTNNIKAGTTTVTYYGKNGYIGKLKKTYKILPYDIANDEAKMIVYNKTITCAYAKGGAKPKPVITFDSKVLREGTDYTLSYKNNRAIGSSSAPCVTINGKGNFQGKIAINFTITPQDLSKMTLVSCDKVYNGKAGTHKIIPKLMDLDGKLLSAGKDFDKNSITYTYETNTNLENGTLKKAGESVEDADIIPVDTQIRVTLGHGSGSNYTGTFTGTYRIVKADIKSAKVTIPTQIYTGGAITPDKQQMKVTLNGNTLHDEDYDIVLCTNNVKKGKASITINGKGNYGGTKTVKFTIAARGFLWWWRKKE